jgi:hypothetical protein
VSAAIVCAIVLLPTGVVAAIRSHHGRDLTASDWGSLTPAQYAAAVRIARAEIAKDHAKVSRAVAVVAGGSVRTTNLPGSCESGRLLIVHLVGDFPTIQVSGFVSPDGSSAPTGPDEWVTVKADATTHQPCLSGVSFGHFEAPPGSADLMPAL